jgi:hypothetical protein
MTAALHACPCCLDMTFSAPLPEVVVHSVLRTALLACIFTSNMSTAYNQIKLSNLPCSMLLEYHAGGAPCSREAQSAEGEE